MLRSAISFFAFLIFTSAALEAADWPRFRGADGNASAPSANVPLTWSATENMAWKTEIPGNGASSATVFYGRVYLTSFTGYGLDPDDPGDREDLQQHVLCFDLVDGKLLWNKSTK
ncbi:MAG TPA: serine/threonine protein kinase, partial [Planctomycetes bacterium]|nr:serine/threonine protein kinase [Planctomycetota bacterium]